MNGMRVGLAIMMLALSVGAPGLGQAQTAPAVVLTARDCRAAGLDAVEHRPDADVAYTPRVDVYGRPVAPADLGGGSTFALPDSLDVPITIDLAERLNLPPRAPELDAVVGVLTLSGADLFINGVPVGGEDARRLRDACRRLLSD